jgi:hypothetical protein
MPKQQGIITPSTTLQPLALFDTMGTAFGIFLANKFAYVADGDNGLVIIDISTPTQSRLRSVIIPSLTIHSPPTFFCDRMER